MKYAVCYNKNFKYFKDVDEVIFTWRGTEQIIDFIPSILKPEQKAIINISEWEQGIQIQEYIPFLQKLKQEHSDILVQINFFLQKDYIPFLQAVDIPFMFADYCKNLDTFVAMRDMGAADIYVVNELGFKLESLNYIKGKMRIRVLPDVPQVERGCTELPYITRFFIRPEDTKLYENIVDVFEIYRNDDNMSTVYRIYKEQYWLGPLDKLLYGFRDKGINNDTIAPHFGLMRLDCGKKCVFGRCSICPNVASLAGQFDEAELTIRREKEKIEISEEEKEELLNNIKENEE